MSYSPVVGRSPKMGQGTPKENTGTEVLLSHLTTMIEARGVGIHSTSCVTYMPS